MPAPVTKSEKVEEKPKTFRAPSREGKRILSVYVPAEMWMQVRLMTLREPEGSVQRLGMEAWNDFFTERGLPRFDDTE